MKKILIVDDDPIFRNSISTTLSAEGYDITLAKSGPEALSLTKATAYDLVVLDYNMQPMNGLDIVKSLRRDKNPCAIIMVTGHGNFDLATEAFSLNVNTILPKPIESGRLAAEVKSALRGSFLEKMGSKPAPKAAATTKTGGSSKIADNVTKVLVVDDSVMYRKTIIHTLTTAFNDFYCIEAVDGQDGVEKLRQNEDVRIIFLDVNMPNISGIEFLKLKRNSKTVSAIPVIVLTTEKERETMSKAYLSGATIFLNKPFERDELIDAVKNVMMWHVKKK